MQSGKTFSIWPAYGKLFTASSSHHKITIKYMSFCRHLLHWLFGIKISTFKCNKREDMNPSSSIPPKRGTPTFLRQGIKSEILRMRPHNKAHSNKSRWHSTKRANKNWRLTRRGAKKAPVTPSDPLPPSHQRTGKKFHTIAGQAKQKFDSRLTLQAIAGRTEKDMAIKQWCGIRLNSN